MRNLILYVIFSFFLLGCKSANKAIQMEQLKTDFPVISLLSKKYNKIKIIKFPIRLKLYNPLWEQKVYSSINYNYNTYVKGIGESLYIEKNGDLKEIRQTKQKTIAPYQSEEYIVYSAYRIDSSDVIQQQFKPYIDEMLKNKQDTLVVGTVKEFKKKHKVFLEQLIMGDSIYLRVLNAERNGYEKGVKIPVKF